MKTIANEIKTETLSLESRGLPSDSYFVVTFFDGSTVSEVNHNWHDFAENVYVEFGDTKKVVQASKFPIKEIKIHHGNLSVLLIANEDEQVYQCLTSTATFKGTNEVEQKIVGRRVGRIKDGRVLEERFLDGRIDEVIGFKF